MQQLEERCLLAAVTWDGGAGNFNWSSPANWSGDLLPTAADDVTIDIAGTNTVTSSSTVSVRSLTSNETVSVTSGSLTLGANSSGTGTILVSGGTVAYTGSNWTNSETININSGTLNLGGSFTTTGLGSVVRTGGTINITGTLDNTGASLNITAAGGAVQLIGGTIIGGTINAVGAQHLFVYSGVLDGVILNGTADVAAANASLAIRNNLELNGSINITGTGGAGNLLLDFFSGSNSNQQITTSSSGVIAMSADNNGDQVYARQTGVSHTVTFGSGITFSGRERANYWGTGYGGGPAFVTGIWENYGTIEANGGSVTSFALATGNTLNNHGTVRTVGSAAFSIPAGTAWTNFAGATMSGNTGGTLNLAGTWSNQGLITGNGGRVNIAGTWSTFGTTSIVSGGSILLNGSYTTALVNTITRDGTGVLFLAGTLDNTGASLNITAASGAVQLFGGTIIGGTINAVGAQHLFVYSGLLDGVILNGTADVAAANASLAIRNNLELNGSINITGTGGADKLLLDFYSGSNSNQQITTSSSGVIAMSADNNGDQVYARQTGVSHTVTFGSGITFSGRERANYWGTGYGGGPVYVTGIWENYGTIEANGGSVTSFALATGNTLNNHGTVRTVGNATFNMAAGTTWTNFAGATMSGNTGGTLNLAGTWSNQGLITGNGGRVNIAGTWSNFGTTSIVSGGSILLNGSYTTALVNTITRNGTGVLFLAGTLDNTNASLNITAAGGAVQLFGGTIIGGTINATGAQHLFVYSGLLDGVILNGTADVAAANASLAIRNNLELNGSINITGTGGADNLLLDFYSGSNSNQQITTSSSGVIAMSADNNGDQVYARQTGVSHTVTFGSGITFSGRERANYWGTGPAFVTGIWENYGTIEANGGSVTSFALATGNTLNNHGTVRTVGSATFSMAAGTAWTNFAGATMSGNTGGTMNLLGTWINRGLITANGGSVNVNSSSWSNLGTIEVTNSGTVNASTSPANFSGGTLTGGTWSVYSGSTLRLPAAVTTEAATILLDGVNSNIYVGSSSTTSALTNLTTVASAGRFTIQNGRNFTTSGPVSDAGILTVGAVGASSTLTLGSTLTVVSGGILQDSGTIIGNVSISGGGTLQGSGTITGNLTNSGAVNPGSSPGILSISGNYTQTAGGTLNLEIGGVNLGTQYDRLALTGSATFDGTLNILVASSFGPSLGQSFTPITFGSTSGAFTTTNLPQYNGAAIYSTTFNPTNLTLTPGALTPDLAFVSMTPPFYAQQSKRIAVPYTVQNIGGVAAVGTWNDVFYLSNDSSLDAADTLLGQVAHTGGLATGASYSGTLDVTVPNVPGENYRILLDVAAGSPDRLRANNAGMSLSAIPIGVDTRPLVLGQQALGDLETPYNVDRWTFSASANQLIRFDLVNSEAANAIRFKLTGPNGVAVFSNLTNDSSEVSLPNTGLYTLEASSNNGGSGAYAFHVDTETKTPLALGTTFNGNFASFAQFFQIDVPTAGPLLIHFDDAVNTEHVSIFGKLNALPNPHGFDVRNESDGADHELAVPFVANGTYYVLVYGDNVAAASQFTLRVEMPPLKVQSVEPNGYATGTTQATAVITGLGFQPGSQVALVPTAGGSAIPAQSVGVDSTSQVTATFDLTGVNVGDFNVRVTLPGGTSFVLTNGFHVEPLGVGELETKLILPGAFGRHALATIYVEYANIGSAAMAAPILTLKSNDPDNSDRPLLTLDYNLVKEGFWTSAIPDGFDNSVQFYGSGAVPGTLQPGERIRVPVYYAGLQQPWDFSDSQNEFVVEVHHADDVTDIDYSDPNLFQRPSWIAENVWPIVYANLQAQIGPDWGGYVRMLSENALYLNQLGEPVTDIGDLYGFELNQALGLDPVGTLASAVDAATPTLSFGRSFGNTISDRYQSGPFGFGWNSSWQISLEQKLDGPNNTPGTVIVHESADSMRRFQPDSRTAGVYFSQTGDTGVMKKIAGGAFELTESSGLKTRFLADGKLNFVRDINGNLITAGFTGNKLTSLSHSDGSSITLTYNAAGLISSTSDSTGRTATFGYDASNANLLSATDQFGTTNYTYATGLGAAREHALLSVTGPSGVTQHFDYDTQGRLTASYLGANIQRVDIAYNSTGKVTITDAAGTISKQYFDQHGMVLRTEDGAGNYVLNEYNDDHQLIRSTDSLGRSTAFTRSATDQLLTMTDPYGRTILTLTPGGPNNAPLAMKDANGNVTQYAYDTVGNPTRTTFADHTFEQATYDTQGNLDVTTNRRNQTVDRTVNSFGQVTHEARSDGTSVDYTYSAHGLLRTATDASGTTTLSYDNADRLTRVDYPNGRWIAYTYDAAGRRTRLEDHSGFVQKYVYDAVGRLERLLNAADALIVKYSYDAAGRLAREDKGNGTYTIYGYDALSQNTSIVHHAPNNSVNSQFSYTYDAAGRRATQTTSDGTWTYSYDLIDELSRAVFVSTNPSIPNQDLNYSYDALGNRTQTVLNGASKNYTANNMNQYTASGSTTFTYDLDGNLTQETGPSGAKTYTYDLQNRLTRVQTPQGIWQYEYDVLGNRTAVVINGVRTEYLIDPTGLGNVLGEYNGSGVRTSGYVHGLGLEASTGASGVGYYDFDAIGSTSGLSGSTGGYVDRYAYDPFGGSLLNSETVANSFEFVGEFGVMNEGNGLTFMRARFYSSSEGRFLSQDPIRLSSGQLNLYSYAGQNPLEFVDPTGLCRKNPQERLQVDRVELRKVGIDAQIELLNLSIERIAKYLADNTLSVPVREANEVRLHSLREERRS